MLTSSLIRPSYTIRATIFEKVFRPKKFSHTLREINVYNTLHYIKLLNYDRLSVVCMTKLFRFWTQFCLLFRCHLISGPFDDLTGLDHSVTGEFIILFPTVYSFHWNFTFLLFFAVLPAKRRWTKKRFIPWKKIWSNKLYRKWRKRNRKYGSMTSMNVYL